MLPALLGTSPTEPSVPLLPAGALPGLLVLVPLSALWLVALGHCALAVWRALRAPGDGLEDQGPHAGGDDDPRGEPLRWLLLLFLGSYVAALVYLARALLRRRRTCTGALT